MGSRERRIKFFPTGSFTHGQFMWYLLFWTTMLGPVPVSRVVVYDHTIEEVVVGSILGFVLGPAWFYTMRALHVPCDVTMDDDALSNSSESDKANLSDT